MNWIKARLAEKSTAAALAGLIGVLLQKVDIPTDINQALTTLILALLLSLGGTKG